MCELPWVDVSEQMATLFVDWDWFIQNKPVLTFFSRGVRRGGLYVCRAHHPDLRVDNQTEKGMEFRTESHSYFATKKPSNQPHAKIGACLQTSHGRELTLIVEEALESFCFSIQGHQGLDEKANVTIGTLYPWDCPALKLLSHCAPQWQKPGMEQPGDWLKRWHIACHLKISSKYIPLEIRRKSVLSNGKILSMKM